MADSAPPVAPQPSATPVSGPMCENCNVKRPALRRPKTGQAVCRDCFFWLFEEEVHQTIVEGGMFERGEKIAIGASGGKDSTVLAYVMKVLNDRHDYGLDLLLLSIDEGIAGYRDDSLETVKRNRDQYQIPLKIVSYKELYGWSMDEIVKEIGLKSNCTFCGVFRRQALDRGAMLMDATKVVTGHNADDLAETILMNLLRGDISRLQRCTAVVTDRDGPLPRAKPFKYAFQKEIVMYAYFRRLDYFSTECIYAPNAYRGNARDFLKQLEQVRPSAILDIINSAENFHFNVPPEKQQVQGNCEKCNYISSQKLCRACVLLEGLNKGKAKISIWESDVPSNRKVKEQAVKSEAATAGPSAETAPAPPASVLKKLGVSSAQSLDF